MDIAGAVEFVGSNHQAVLHTTRKDGGPQLSPVAVAADDEGRLLISSRETAIKTKNLVRNPRAAVCVLNPSFYGDWVFIEGDCEVVHLPEAMDLLVDYYRRVAGEHPDWDEYRSAMERDRRVVLRIAPDRAGPNISG